MYLVFFKKEHLGEFLHKIPEMRLNEGFPHETIYKIIKNYPDYPQYSNEFYANLKRSLREYRYFVIDDVKKIENLSYSLTLELPDDFPVDAILDKKHLAKEQQKMADFQTNIWQIIDQLKNTIEIPSQKADVVKDTTVLSVEDKQDSSSSCFPFKQWFKQCRAMLFSPPNGYKPLPSSPDNPTESADENLRIK